MEWWQFRVLLIVCAAASLLGGVHDWFTEDFKH